MGKETFYGDGLIVMWYHTRGSHDRGIKIVYPGFFFFISQQWELKNFQTYLTGVFIK